MQVSRSDKIGFGGLLSATYTSKRSARMIHNDAVNVCVVGDNQLIRVVNEFLPKGKLRIQFSKERGFDTLVFESRDSRVIKRLVKEVSDEAKSKMNSAQREILGSRKIHSISYALMSIDYLDLKKFPNNFKFKTFFALRKFKKNIKEACPSAEQRKWLADFFKPKQYK